MKFDNLKDLILHSYKSPIPLDVKIGEAYSSMKIFRSGHVHIKPYIPERDFVVDVSNLNLSETGIDRHISKELCGQLNPDESLVATVNGMVCTIKKIKNHTVVIFYVKPMFEFVDEESMRNDIKIATEKLNNNARVES